MSRILDFNDTQSSPSAPSAGTTLYFAEFVEFTLDAAAGTSVDVSALFAAKSSGGAAATEGVITDNPTNYISIL